jgi:hypothetical protein
LVGHDIWTEGTSYTTLMEISKVYAGSQAMPLYYDNTSGPGRSEAIRTFAPAQNWTAEGVTTLVVHFRGTAGNTMGQLYAKINGVKVPYNGASDDIASRRYLAWPIDLASLGVNLAAVTELTIGVEGAETGVVYVDAIRLTRP